MTERVMELARSYWQVLLAGLVAIIKLAYCSSAQELHGFNTSWAQIFLLEFLHSLILFFHL